MAMNYRIKHVMEELAPHMLRFSYTMIQECGNCGNILLEVVNYLCYCGHKIRITQGVPDTKEDIVVADDICDPFTVCLSSSVTQLADLWFL